MADDTQNAVTDALIDLLTDIHEEAGELLVRSWPTDLTAVRVRADQLVSIGEEFAAVCRTLKAVQSRFDITQYET